MAHYPGWEAFQALSLEEKSKRFMRDGALFDIVYAQQFSKEYLFQLFSTAETIRTIAKTKQGCDFIATLLSDKRAMLFFVQPSTRTFLSFLSACHLLGMRTSEIRDVTTSSEVKGESPEDTIRTFSSYVDLIITRHPDEGFVEMAAWVLNEHANRAIPVINGGSGKDQHPTQALLDIYTLHRALEKLGGIEGKTIMMSGDLRRGRTVRSLCRLLALYNNVTIELVAPEKYRMRRDVVEWLKQKNVKVSETEDFDSALKQADAIYATRLQNEYDKEGEASSISERFYLTENHLPYLKEHAVIMHPFPRRDEIAVTLDHDPRAHYWKQARNGMWIRAALILTLFQRQHCLDQFPKL